MIKNLQKSVAASEARKDKPLQWRFNLHGTKGTTRRWFPEYAVKFPNHLKKPIHSNKALPNVLPQWREHFCDFLDGKRQLWVERNCTVEEILNSPYEEPYGPTRAGNLAHHKHVLNRLHVYGLMPRLHLKWLKHNPDRQSPSGKRIATGDTAHFDLYAESVLDKLDTFLSHISEEALRVSKEFENQINLERETRKQQMEEMRRKGLETDRRNKEIAKRRSKALRERKKFLRQWRLKYADLFPEDWMNSRKRKALYRAGEAEDTQVKRIVRSIKSDRQNCYWCGKLCKYGATVDHVVPLSKGGKHASFNLVPACPRCNTDKATILPDSPQMPEKFHLELVLT